MAPLEIQMFCRRCVCVCLPFICAKSCLPCAVLTVGLLHQILGVFNLLMSTNTLLYQLL